MCQSCSEWCMFQAGNVHDNDSFGLPTSHHSLRLPRFPKWAAQGPRRHPDGLLAPLLHSHPTSPGNKSIAVIADFETNNQHGNIAVIDWNLNTVLHDFSIHHAIDHFTQPCIISSIGHEMESWDICAIEFCLLKIPCGKTPLVEP